MKYILQQVLRVQEALHSGQDFLKRNRELDAASMLSAALAILDLSVIPALRGMDSAFDYDDTVPQRCTKCGLPLDDEPLGVS